MIVDLGRIEAADRNGRKERGQKTGAGVGQLVQNERAACNHGQDSEKAGAGGWLQHAVGRRDTRSGQRGNAERKRRDRKSVVEGKSVSVRVDLGGRRIMKKKNNTTHTQTRT